MLTPADVKAFQRDGYFIERGVFSKPDLDLLRPLARKIQDKTRAKLYPGTRFWYGNKEDRKIIPDHLKPLATWGVNEITRRILFEPELVNVFAHPKVDHAMQALLGPEPRAWGIKILWTPKVVGYNLGWHRDQVGHDLYDFVHLKPEPQDHVQFNAALNDDDCFIVVPGSHRRPLNQAEWHALKNDRTADLPGQIVTDLAPGDILYMDAHALHRGRSTVEGDRLTLHYSAQAQWVPLHPWGEDEDFAFITSDEFINQLSPAARPYYLRLRTAERTDDSMSFLKQKALTHGWSPTPDKIPM